jgi:hypothetical protein
VLQDALSTAQADLAREMSKISTELADMAEKRGDDYAEAMGKVRFLRKSVEGLKERTWELDSSTVDNLVFYGIEEDNVSDNTEVAVKEVSEDQKVADDFMAILAGDPLQATHTA